jgi:transcriptional regulator with XRE-family HTH domain
MHDQNPSLAFGRLLKYWRGVRSLSQEDLSFELDCSTRHISRIESGRGHPSETIIEDIARALSLRDRDRNHLRLSAGYAAEKNETDIFTPRFLWLRKAIIKNLRALDPTPTMVVSNNSNIVMVNRGWVNYFQKLLPPDELNNIVNQWDFIFGRVAEGSEDAVSLILMALQQWALMSGDDSVQETVDRLVLHARVPNGWEDRASKLEPRASYWLTLVFDGKPRRFLSVTCEVNAFGPNEFHSEPRFLIHTLYPEFENAGDSKLLSVNLTHPKLFY